MAIIRPTLRPDDSLEDAPTEELLPAGASIGEQVGMWRLGEVVRVAPSVTGATAESSLGRGVFITSKSRDQSAGNAWVGQATRWLRTHGIGDVPRLLDHGMASDGRLWMVRSATTPSWRQLLDQRGPLPLLSAVRALEAAATSLAPVHAAGWVHQALTLDVLHAQDSGRACVSGWGHVGTSTAPSAPVGRNSWVSSQATASDTGTRQDIKALGLLMLELLTCDARVLRRAGRVGDAVRTALPSAGIEHRVLRHIIGSAVHPTPQERWPDARTLAHELRSWLESFGENQPAAGEWMP